jgi:tetratricopeptide (TPR) repeat protein
LKSKRTSQANPKPQAAAADLASEVSSSAGDSTAPSSASIGKAVAALVLIACAVCITYGNTLKNDFIHDDRAEILLNPYVRDSSNIWKIFTTAAWAFGSVGPYTFSSNYYRPVQYLSYAVLYRIFGSEPWGYHLYKLLSHLIVSWLVFWIYRRCLQEYSASLLGALVFAVHPANTEAVSWISGITDTTCALLFLLSLAIYLKDRADPSHSKLLALSGLFLIGLLAKETMAMFLAAIFVYDWLETGRFPRLRQFARVLVPLLAVFVIYLVLRINAIGAFTNPKQVQFRFDYLNLFQLLLNQTILLSKYVALFFFPAELNAYHLFDPVISPFSLRFGIAATLLTVGWMIFRSLSTRMPRDRRRWMLFGLAWFLLTLLPVILFFKRLGENVFAERYIYLPSIGLCLALFSTLPAVKSWRFKAAGFVLAGLIALLSWMSVVRNRVWQDELVFYETTARQSPKAASILNNLGAAYNKRQRPLDAIRAFEASVSVHPSPHALKNMGYTLAAVGRHEESEAAYRRAILLDPSDAGAYAGLGDVQAQRGQFADAIVSYRRSLAIYPNSTIALFSLAEACLMVQRYDDAIVALERVLALSQAERPRAYRLLANAYRAMNIPDLAADAERRAAAPVGVQLFR